VIASHKLLIIQAQRTIDWLCMWYCHLLWCRS